MNSQSIKAGCAAMMNIRIERRSLASVSANASQPAPVSQTFAAAGPAFYVSATLAFLASVAFTIYLCGSMSGGMPMPGGWTMSMAWMRMPGRSWLGSEVSSITMWVAMMMAMMLPSLVPMLLGYRRSINPPGTALCSRMTMLVSAGYFFMWALIGLVVYPLGVVMTDAAMRWPALARGVPVATGIVLVLAGWLQLTAWKARQLERCRSAPACNQKVSPDAWSACQHGLYLGMRCILCCISLMLVLFVSGVLDLSAMAVVTGAITLERMAPWPRRVARITGVSILAVGMFRITGALWGAT
jgi:predicted metal-binding membrane protein